MESKTIDGVYVKRIVRHTDERGYFAELFKRGEPGFHTIAQTSYSLIKPGVVKAFHYHNYWETWVVIEGSAKIVIYDTRDGSPTKGVTQIIYARQDEPVVVSIPPNVAHGYKAIGEKECGMLYHAEEAYDPSRKDQIGTIPQDSADIGFDWSQE